MAVVLVAPAMWLSNRWSEALKSGQQRSTRSPRLSDEAWDRWAYPQGRNAIM